mgnify:CR=1 FL=1
MTGERRMRAQQIIRLACDIKSVWKTNNPFEIAESNGIKVLIRNVNIGDFKAQTLKMKGIRRLYLLMAYTARCHKKFCVHTNWDTPCCIQNRLTILMLRQKMSIRMWNMKPICLPWHCFVMKMNLICRLPR